jgi:hypothetical protein
VLLLCGKNAAPWNVAAKGHSSQVSGAKLPWVATLVLPDPGAIAGRSPLLSIWLKEILSSAADVGMLAAWQELVDALVVAGDIRLAPYSE